MDSFEVNTHGQITGYVNKEESNRKVHYVDEEELQPGEEEEEQQREDRLEVREQEEEQEPGEEEQQQREEPERREEGEEQGPAEEEQEQRELEPREAGEERDPIQEDQQIGEDSEQLQNSEQGFTFDHNANMNIFISRNLDINHRELLDIEKRWVKKPKETVRRLLKALVGVERLREMTLTGRNGNDPIPNPVMNAIFGK